MSASNGGPAYPSLDVWRNDGDQLAHAPDGQVVAPGCAISIHHPGMTLRDYFAAKALPGVLNMVAHGVHSAASSADGCAVEAYRLADAMLKARSA